VNKKRRLMLAAVLIGMAVVGLAGWASARPAVASPESVKAAKKYFATRSDAGGRVHRLRGEHGSFRFEVRDDESDDREFDDRGDSTSTTGGVTATTAGSGATTATTEATTTTTGATTTTTQAATTTTQATTATTQATTTTTQAPATTATTAIDAASLFSAYCVSCHDPSGVAIRTTLTAAQILTKITTGSMSSYASSLDSAHKTALANYVAGGGR
jgi:mono/diheme cytochrome c family protein